MLVEKYGNLLDSVIVSGINSNTPFDILSDIVFGFLKDPCKKM